MMRVNENARIMNARSESRLGPNVIRARGPFRRRGRVGCCLALSGRRGKPVLLFDRGCVWRGPNREISMRIRVAGCRLIMQWPFSGSRAEGGRDDKV